MFCFILAIRAESLLYGLLQEGAPSPLIANPGKLKLGSAKVGYENVLFYTLVTDNTGGGV